MNTSPLQKSIPSQLTFHFKKFKLFLASKSHNQIHLSYKDTWVSSQATFIQQAYIIEDELTIKQSLELDKEIQIYVVAASRRQYHTIGLFSISKLEIIKGKGKRIKKRLNDCEDTRAEIEFDVDTTRVFEITNHRKELSFTDRPSTIEINDSPNLQDFGRINLVENSNSCQTKSEYYTSVINPQKYLKSARLNEQTPFSSVNSNNLNLKMKKKMDFHVTRNSSPICIQEDDHKNYLEDHDLQELTYTHHLEKIKKKHQQELDQRSQTIQKMENQINFIRLESSRQRIRLEELQKQVAAKNERIKEMGLEVAKYKEQEKIISINYEEIRVKNRKILMLQEKVGLMSKETKEISEVASTSVNQYENRQKELKKEIEDAKNEWAVRQESLLSHLAKVEKQFSSYRTNSENTAIAVKAATQKLHQRLQESDKKVVEMQKTILGFKINLKEKEESQIELERLLKDVEEANKKKQALESQVSDLKSALNASTFRIKGLEEELSNSEQSELELKRVKSSYDKEMVKNDKLMSENQALHSQIEQLNQGHESEIAKIQNNFYKKMNIYEVKLKRLQEEKESEDLKRAKDKNQMQNAKESENVKSLKTKIEALKIDLSTVRDSEKRNKSLVYQKQKQISNLKYELEELRSIKTYEIGRKRKTQKTVDNSHYYDNFQRVFDKSTFVEEKRYFEMQMLEERNKSANLESIVTKLNENYDNLCQSYNRQEKQWQQERKRLQCSIQKFIKSQKELMKHNEEKEQRIESLEQKLQKQRKVKMAQGQKMGAFENLVARLREELEEAKGIKAQFQRQVKALEGQVSYLANELQYLKQEKTKGIKLIQSKQAQILELEAKIENLQQSSRCEDDNFKLLLKNNRDEFIKIENKFNNYRKQAQKFKECLRMMIVSFGQKWSQQNGQNQEYFELTLTQELIYVLETFLGKLLDQLSSVKGHNRELTEELTATKQETILSTNKFHNVETTLIQKQQQIESQIERLQVFQFEKENQFEDTVQSYHQEIKSLKNEQKKLQNEKEDLTVQSSALRQELEKAKDNFQHQSSKLKQRLKQAEQNQNEFVNQIMQLEQRIEEEEHVRRALKQQLSEMKIKEVKLKSKIGELNEYILEKNKQKEEICKKNKEINELVSNLNQKIEEIGDDLQLKAIQVIELNFHQQQASNLAKTLISEKESTLQKYLTVCEKNVEYQNKMLQIEHHQDAIKQENENQKKAIYRLKEQKTKLTGEIKKLELVLDQNNSKFKALEDKLRQRERKSERSEQETKDMLQALGIKIKQEETSKKTLIDELDSLKQQYESIVRSKQIQVANMESRIKQKQHLVERYSQEVTKIRQLMQTAAQKNDQSQQKEHLFDQTIEKHQKQIAALKSSLQKAGKEIEQKDLKLFEIASSIYQKQLNFEEQIRLLTQKNFTLQCTMIKYEQICDDYSHVDQRLKKQIIGLKEKIESIQNAFKHQEQENKKLKQLIEAERSTNIDLQSKIALFREEKIELLSTKNSQIRVLKQENVRTQEDHARIQIQLYRSQGELQRTIASLKQVDESRLKAESSYSLIIKQLQYQLDASKKKQIQGKHKAEWLKEKQWSLERQIKKVIQNSLKVVGLVESSQKFQEAIKSMEDAIMNSIKSDFEFQKQ